jgi:hypothetical protein
MLTHSWVGKYVIHHLKYISSRNSSPTYHPPITHPPSALCLLFAQGIYENYSCSSIGEYQKAKYEIILERDSEQLHVLASLPTGRNGTQPSQHGLPPDQRPSLKNTS